MACPDEDGGRHNRVVGIQACGACSGDHLSNCRISAIDHGFDHHGEALVGQATCSLIGPGITQVGCAEVEVKTDARIIVAFYTGPAPLDTNELGQFAADRLARYKCPRAFVRLDDMPVSANGKLLRRALPALYESET